MNCPYKKNIRTEQCSVPTEKESRNKPGGCEFVKVGVQHAVPLPIKNVRQNRRTLRTTSKAEA